MGPWNSWAIATVSTEGVNYLPNVMVAEYPVGDSGKPVTIGGAGGWVIVKQPNKEKLAKVVEFAKFLSTAEEQYKFARFYGTFPSRFSTMEMDPFADRPLMKRAMEMLEFAEAVPDHPNWAQIDERIQAELQLIFAGEKTVEQGMQDAARAVERLLR